MSFSSKTWTSGQKIGADDLNRLEDRVEEIREIYDNVFSIENPPTWRQVVNMLSNDIIPVIYDPSAKGYLYITYFSNPTGTIEYRSSSNAQYFYSDMLGQLTFYSNSENGPVSLESNVGEMI